MSDYEECLSQYKLHTLFGLVTRRCFYNDMNIAAQGLKMLRNIYIKIIKQNVNKNYYTQKHVLNEYDHIMQKKL